MPSRPPFLILSLPRSRSAWLSVLLCGGHDLAIEADTPSALVSAIYAAGGSCETGVAQFWPLLRHMMPAARMAVVLRPPNEVVERLAVLGLPGQEQEMAQRHAALLALAQRSGVLTVHSTQLDNSATVAALWRHCKSPEPPEERIERLMAMRVEVDLPRRVQRLLARQEAIAGLRRAAMAMQAAL